ncbi:transposase [Algoriphagus sp. NBT04N3]|nr:DDE-type integrase/transposase/recombinase [Algoriphagus sp. NBT04N3]QYH39949.1 transposase [Algoriphagus sp. NBT04N3]
MSNGQVVELIRSICLEPFLNYGADMMCLELKNRGLLINKKKVYRLMKEHRLLYPKRARNETKSRKRVVSNSPCAQFPFQTIELDIKYIYVSGANRTAYLLTALDTFSRLALAWTLDYRMKAGQVVALIKRMFQEYPETSESQPLLRIRTDNGPQFISKELRSAIQQLPFEHEFIQPGVPQQNGHIESFHHIVSKSVTSGYEFQDLIHARAVFSEFFRVYNRKRIKKELLGKSPEQFLSLWNQEKIGLRTNGKKVKFFFKEKPSLGSGSPCEDVHSAIRTKSINNLNSIPLTNSVQFIGG